MTFYLITVRLESFLMNLTTPLHATPPPTSTLAIQPSPKPPTVQLIHQVSVSAPVSKRQKGPTVTNGARCVTETMTNATLPAQMALATLMLTETEFVSAWVTTTDQIAHNCLAITILKGTIVMIQ